MKTSPNNKSRTKKELDNLVAGIERDWNEINSVDVNGLYVWLTKLYISQTKNEQLLSIYSDILKYLNKEKKNNDEGLSVFANSNFGIRDMYLIDTFDLHSIYFESEVNLKLLSKLIFLEDYIDEGDSYFMEYIQASCRKMFNLDFDYKKGQKSDFFNVSPVYGDFRKSRQDNKFKIDYNINVLKKIIS